MIVGAISEFMAASQNRTVLVTGGAGYIGSHVCKRLSQEGYLPVTYDNLSRGHRWAVQWGPLEQGCVNDKNRLTQTFEHYRPDCVFHLAGYTLVGESVEDPALYYESIVLGTVSLLEVMRKRKSAIPLIYSSSCAVYGSPQTIPMSESHPKSPINPYGRAKLIAEQILKDYDLAYGMRSVALRYFNASGADPDGDVGEAHDPETHLIPLILETAAGRRDRIAIFGTDFGTPDGTCVRDYLHVTDIAEAHLRAMTYLAEGNPSRAFNLGTGQGHSVHQVIKTARQVTGRDIPVEEAERRVGDPPELVADARRAQTVLAWKPRRASLNGIIQDAWKWGQQRLG